MLIAIYCENQYIPLQQVLLQKYKWCDDTTELWSNNCIKWLVVDTFENYFYYVNANIDAYKDAQVKKFDIRLKFSEIYNNVHFFIDYYKQYHSIFEQTVVAE